MGNIVLSHSQNFIKSNRLLDQLITKSGINSDDLLIEIGAGKGKITKILAERAKEVWAIEKDPELAEYAKRNLQATNIKIFNEDFIRFKLPLDREYKIFSNIPFNRSADIMHKILHTKNPPIDCYLILQKEAAERYTGTGNKEGQTSVFYKGYMQFNIIHIFKPIDFTPVPSVTPVLLNIKRRDSFLNDANQKAEYQKFVIYGFNQWSKNIVDTFKKVFTFEQLKRLASINKFSLNAKPSDLSSNQWEALFSYYLTGVVRQKKLFVEQFYKKYLTDTKKVAKIRRTTN